jgi:hypothetical protein
LVECGEEAQELLVYTIEKMEAVLNVFDTLTPD